MTGMARGIPTRPTGDMGLAGNVIGETLTDDARAQAVVDRFLADLEASEKAAQ